MGKTSTTDKRFETKPGPEAATNADASDETPDSSTTSSAKRPAWGFPADYPERWKRWTKRFRGHGSKRRVKALRIADKIIVALFVVLYVIMGLGCIGATPGAVIGYLASTAACFALVSLLRWWRNEPRPYETFAIKPLMPKTSLKCGKSFPSRHTFCAFLIATMFAIVFHSLAGLIPLALAAALAYIRVLEGVHYPRDVVAGALLGVLAGFACTAAIIA